MPNAEINLRDYLRSYPGGLAALARDTGLSRTMVYGLAHGSAGGSPWDAIGMVVEAFSERKTVLEQWDAEKVFMKWQDAKRTRLRTELRELDTTPDMAIVADKDGNPIAQIDLGEA